MSEGNLLHLASAVIMFAAAIVPIYLSLRLKRNLRILTFLLAVFILFHGIYHLAYYFGEEELGEGLFRTVSIVVLIIFGIAFIKMARSKKEKLTV
jgi:chromate transport protein ChrA